MQGTSIKRIVLKPQHDNTNNTRHVVMGSPINNEIAELRIMHYPDDPGYYLLYFDILGKELTDTFHDSLTQAFEQAEFEFNVKADEWEDINETY